MPSLTNENLSSVCTDLHAHTPWLVCVLLTSSTAHWEIALVYSLWCHWYTWDCCLWWMSSLHEWFLHLRLHCSHLLKEKVKQKKRPINRQYNRLAFFLSLSMFSQVIASVFLLKWQHLEVNLNYYLQLWVYYSECKSKHQKSGVLSSPFHFL